VIQDAHQKNNRTYSGISFSKEGFQPTNFKPAQTQGTNNEYNIEYLADTADGQASTFQEAI